MSKPKRGPGRPPLPDSERKDLKLEVRFSPSDIQRLHAAAKKAKLGLSAWVRQRLGLDE